MSEPLEKGTTNFHFAVGDIVRLGGDSRFVHFMMGNPMEKLSADSFGIVLGYDARSWCVIIATEVGIGFIVVDPGYNRIAVV